MHIRTFFCSLMLKYYTFLVIFGKTQDIEAKEMEKSQISISEVESLEFITIDLRPDIAGVLGMR